MHTAIPTQPSLTPERPPLLDLTAFLTMIQQAQDVDRLTEIMESMDDRCRNDSIHVLDEYWAAMITAIADWLAVNGDVPTKACA